MSRKMQGGDFDKLKAGEMWITDEETQHFSVNDYTVLWILKDINAPHNFEEDTIFVHQFDKESVDGSQKNLLRLNKRIGLERWMQIGYEDMGLELSEENYQKKLIWAVFEAEKIVGKL
jgi:hypothetical protein